jgi:hypothetical protein
MYGDFKNVRRGVGRMNRVVGTFHYFSPCEEGKIEIEKKFRR